MTYADFKHDRTGLIYKLPAHFATAKIGKNFTLIEDETETEKVVVSHTPNSQKRTALVEKPDEDEVPVFTFDKEEDE